MGGDVETVESGGCVGADGVIVGEEDRHQLLDTHPEILHDFAVLKLPSSGEEAKPFVGAGEGESVVFKPCLRMQLGDGFQGVVGADLYVDAGLVGETVSGVFDCRFCGVAFDDAPCADVEDCDDCAGAEFHVCIGFMVTMRELIRLPSSDEGSPVRSRLRWWRSRTGRSSSPTTSATRRWRRAWHRGGRRRLSRSRHP